MRRRQLGVQGVRTTVFEKGKPTLIRTGALTLKEARPYEGEDQEHASSAAMVTEDGTEQKALLQDSKDEVGTLKQKDACDQSASEAKNLDTRVDTTSSSSTDLQSHAVGTDDQSMVTQKSRSDNVKKDESGTDEEDGTDSDSSDVTDVTDELKKFEVEMKHEVNLLRMFNHFAKYKKERKPYKESSTKDPSVTSRLKKQFIKLQDKIYDLKDLATTFNEQRMKAEKEKEAARALAKQWEAKCHALEAKLRGAKK